MRFSLGALESMMAIRKARGREICENVNAT
jgi:hypothetical protein